MYIYIYMYMRRSCEEEPVKCPPPPFLEQRVCRRPRLQETVHPSRMTIGP